MVRVMPCAAVADVPGQEASTTVAPNVPCSTGVPASSPVDGSRTTPVGRRPLVTAQVAPGALAENVWL